MSNLKKEKKELLKKMNDLVKDLMDNYEKYSEPEREAVESQMKGMVSLNSLLEKYDPRKPKWYEEIINAFTNFFGKN